MKKAAWVILIAAATLFAWRGLRSDDERRGSDLFFGRVWVDRLPHGETDTFHVFGTADRQPLGWVAERARWKGAWEIFRYEARGEGKVELTFPHSGKTLRASYRAWRCNEGGYDYCLEISGVPGPSKYVSRKGWERRRLDLAVPDADPR
jgi:hypothetical protein